MMEKFHTNLKVLRAQKNITQDELAKQVGVVRQTIAYIERGDYMPSLGLAYRIAKVFGRGIEEIFHFETKKGQA